MFVESVKIVYCSLLYSCEIIMFDLIICTNFVIFKFCLYFFVTQEKQNQIILELEGNLFNSFSFAVLEFPLHMSVNVPIRVSLNMSNDLELYLLRAFLLIFEQLLLPQRSSLPLDRICPSLTSIQYFLF